LQYIDGADIREVMEDYNESDIDSEFIPYINRINKLQCVVTCQCCIGHVPYNETKLLEYSENKPPKFGTNVSIEQRPKDATDHWGYIALYVTEDMIELLAERFNFLKQSDWFWGHGSKVWYGYADTMDYGLFTVSDNGSAHIVFAWDAKHWPQPAEDITKALENCARYLQETT